MLISCVCSLFLLGSMYDYNKLDVEAIRKSIVESKESNPRTVFQHLAHMAELAERHDDMCMLMREVVKIAKDGKDLSLQERNLLSIAFKNAVGQRRAAWRVALNDNDSSLDALSKSFRHSIEKEIEPCCRDVLDLLENYLIPHPASNSDSQIFYQKMAGDYYRYLAEIRPNDDDVRAQSSKFYGRAMATAERALLPTDPVRLGLALNYSVCLYEIINDRPAACVLARQAFDLAVAELRNIDPSDALYRDCTLILQLLKDNLSLWVPEANNNLAPLEQE